VIELLTVDATVDNGTRMTGQININGQGGTSHFFNVPFGATFGGNDDLVLTQPLRLYADAGTGTVQIVLAANTTLGGGANVSISGYLVDLP
jgi:hypothetical protein